MKFCLKIPSAKTWNPFFWLARSRDHFLVLQSRTRFTSLFYKMSKFFNPLSLSEGLKIKIQLDLIWTCPTCKIEAYKKFLFSFSAIMVQDIVSTFRNQNIKKYFNLQPRNIKYFKWFGSAILFSRKGDKSTELWRGWVLLVPLAFLEAQY